MRASIGSGTDGDGDEGESDVGDRSGAGDGVERESFRPSGQLTGWSCLALAAAVVVLYVVEHDRGMPLWVLVAALCFASVAWAVLLRPRVALTGSALELRNSFETVTLPLARVDSIAVGRILSVEVGERHWTSAALGRSVRQARRDDEAIAATPPGAAVGTGRVTLSYAALVESRLQQVVVESQSGRSGRMDTGAADRVVRRRDPLPIALVVATALATVVALFV